MRWAITVPVPRRAQIAQKELARILLSVVAVPEEEVD